MLLRLEICGHYLQVEIGARERPAEAEERPPVDVPQPMVTYAEPPGDPLGFHVPEVRDG